MKKGIDNPTTERLLKTFDNVTLTIVNLPGQIIRHITPLSALQIRILELLQLYHGTSTPNWLRIDQSQKLSANGQ